MKKVYSKKILISWESFCKNYECEYTFDEENGKLYFKIYSDVLSQELECMVQIDSKNYKLFIKMPVSFDESKLDVVEDYILLSNGNPIFSHFSIDYDTNIVYGVNGVFCGGQVVHSTSIEEILYITKGNVEYFYKGLKTLIEKDISAEEAYAIR